MPFGALRGAAAAVVPARRSVRGNRDSLQPEPTGGAVTLPVHAAPGVARLATGQSCRSAMPYAGYESRAIDVRMARRRSPMFIAVIA